MPDQRLTRFVSAIDPLDPDIQTNNDVVYILEEFCKPDINLGGSIDFFNISVFLASYQAGCP